MDREEFEFLFKKHFKGLSFFALEYVKDYDIAREVVQEVFTNLWLKRDTIEPGKSPQSYLGTSVKNRCLNYLRDHRKFDHSIIEFEGLDQREYAEHDQLVTEELKQLIEEAIASLPAKCRAIFTLNRLENKKYQEIADEMNISVKTVEAQMTKALKIMRQKLSEFITLFILIIKLLFP